MSSAKIDDSFLEESVGNVEFTVKSIGYIIIIYKLCIHYISKINKIGNELMHILIYIVVLQSLHSVHPQGGKNVSTDPNSVLECTSFKRVKDYIHKYQFCLLVLLFHET